MEPRFIFTADDFGPLDFINEGIFEAVRLNIINSVHVLVNGDTEDDLLRKLRMLNSCVTELRTLDIGIHFTLTSGIPLSGDTHAEKKMIWKKMVYEKNGICYFQDQQSFYHDFHEESNGDHYTRAIHRELEMQRDLLRSLISKIKTDTPNCRLNFTSASSHHGLLNTSMQLFEIYISVIGALALRSPKQYPPNVSSRYPNFIPYFFRSDFWRQHNKTARPLSAAFSYNVYLGEQNLKLKCPSYTDMELYCTLGSSLRFNRFKKRKTENKMDRFYEMCKRALHYRLLPGIDPRNNKIIELVFHLGYAPENMKTVKKNAGRYPGIMTRYFDDRCYELGALKQIASDNFINYVFAQTASWSECEFVHFTSKNAKKASDNS